MLLCCDAVALSYCKSETVGDVLSIKSLAEIHEPQIHPPHDSCKCKLPSSMIAVSVNIWSRVEVASVSHSIYMLLTRKNSKAYKIFILIINKIKTNNFLNSY